MLERNQNSAPRNAAISIDIEFPGIDIEAQVRLRKSGELENALWNIFAEMPGSIFSEFKKSIIQESVYGFLCSLSEETLKRHNCTDRQIRIVLLLMEALMTIYTGEYLANSAAFLTSSTLSYCGFSARSCAIGGAAASSVVTIARNFSAIGIAKTASSLAAGYCAGRFAIWAKDKVISRYDTCMQGNSDEEAVLVMQAKYDRVAFEV